HRGEAGVGQQQVPLGHLVSGLLIGGQAMLQTRPILCKGRLMAAAFPRIARLFASTALLPGGREQDVLLEVDEEGWIRNVQTGASPEGAEQAAGPLLPGMPNLHGHAFQRAMAGLAERAVDAEDSFWTWREIMYGFVRRLGPDEAEAVA